MSQLASFHVLPANRLDDLMEAATLKQVVRKIRLLGIIPITKSEQEDLFWEFLEANARECAGPEAGSIFCELDLFLDENHTMLFDLALKEPSDQLTRARGSANGIFDYTAAQKAKAMLHEVEFSAEAIRTYCESGGSKFTAEELIHPLQSAAAIAESWMNDVTPSDIGILMIG